MEEWMGRTVYEWGQSEPFQVGPLKREQKSGLGWLLIPEARSSKVE